MKSARQWADHLPEPIRTQFLENCEDLEMEHRSLDHAIHYQFIWEFTPEDQGYYYWENIWDKAKDGHYDKPLNEQQ